MALLIWEMLNEGGIQASMEVVTPQPLSLPVLGQTGCDVIESRLAANGITSSQIAKLWL